MSARSALKRLGLVFAASVALTLLVAGVALAEPRIKTKGCEVYDTNRVDPIAHMEHMHHQFGNTSTTDESTGEGLLENVSTSCDTDWFTTAGWFPVERDEPVKGVAVYYRAPGDQEDVKEIPEGLQLLAEEVKYNCTATGEGSFEDTPPYGCKGNWTTRVEFPDCWSTKSKEEDSTVYSKKGVCPPTHPHRFPQISFLIQHDNADGKVPEPLMVSAGVDAWEPYTSMHADYFAANQPELNDRLIGRCLRDAPDGTTIAHPSCGTEGGTPAPEGSVPRTLEPTPPPGTTEPESTTPEAAPPEGTTPETPTGPEEGTSTEEGACPAGRVVMSGSGSGQAETPAFSTEGAAIGLTVDAEDDPPDGQPISATLVGEDGTEQTTLEVSGQGRTSSVVSAEAGTHTVRIDSGEVGYRLTVQDCPPSGDGGATTPEWTAPEQSAPEGTTPEETLPGSTIPQITTPEPTPPETTEPESTIPEVTPPQTTAPETTALEQTLPEPDPETGTTEPPLASGLPTEGTCPGGRVVMSGSGSGEAETPPFSTEGTAIGVSIEPEAEPSEQQPVSATLVEEDGGETTLEHDGAEPASFLVPAEPGSYTARIDSGEVGYRLTVQDCPAEGEGPTGDTERTTPEETTLEQTVAPPEPTAPEQAPPDPGATTGSAAPTSPHHPATFGDLTGEQAPASGTFPGIRWYPTMGVYAGSEKGWVHEPDIVDRQFADYVGAANEDAYLDLDDDGERYWFCGGRKITWKDALVDEDLAPADRAQAQDPGWSNYKWNQPGEDVIEEQLDASETIAADKSKLCLFVATTATSVKNPVPAFMLDDPDGLTWTDGQGKDHVRLDKPEAYEAMADFLIALTRQYGDDPRVASITLGEYYTNDDAGGLPQDLDEGAFAANIEQVWSRVIAAAPKDANGDRVNFVQSQPITEGGVLTAEDIASIGVGVSGSGAQLFSGGPVDDIRQPLRGVVPMQHQVNTGPLGQPATWDGTPNPWGFEEGQSVSTEYEHVAWYFGSKGVAPLDSLMMRDDDRYAEDWHDAYGRFGPNGSMAAQWGQIPAETSSGSEEGPGPAPGQPAAPGTPPGGTCPGARVVMSGSGSGEAETPAFSVGGPSLRLTVEPGALPEGRPISVALIGEDGAREATLEHAGEEPESSVVSAEAGRYSVEMDSGEAPYRLTVEDCQATPEGPTGDTMSTAPEQTAPGGLVPEPTVPEQTLAGLG